MIPDMLFVIGGFDSGATISQLQKAADPSHDDFKEVFLASLEIDASIVHAIRRLLDSREIDGIHFGKCTGLMHHVLGAACSRGVAKISIFCDSPRLDKVLCQALSRSLRFGQIRKLVLQTGLNTELGKALYDGLAYAPNNTLEVLSIPLSHACWESIRLLSATLPCCRALRKLSLNRHDLLSTLDEGHLEALMKSLGNHPSLKELCIQGSSCPEGGIIAMAEHLLGPQSCLEKLDLSNHRFGIDILAGTRFLTTALATNTTLKCLSLSGHKLSDDDMDALSIALASQSNLVEELCLTECQITDNGISVFAERISEMATLKALWLLNNPFDTHSALKLLDGVCENPNIEFLTLPQGRRMRDVQQKLDFWLFLNRSGRRLLRSHGIPPYLWALVLERASTKPLDSAQSHATNRGDPIHKFSSNIRLSSIFYFLRHGSILI